MFDFRLDNLPTYILIGSDVGKPEICPMYCSVNFVIFFKMSFSNQKDLHIDLG